MQRFCMTALLFFSLVVASGAVRAEVAHDATIPPKPSVTKEISLSTAIPSGSGKESMNLVLQSRLQRAGKAVLATAFAIILAGVVLIEVDPYSIAIGDWGFAAVGVGLGAFITSAFMLGLSRPVHFRDHPAERKHRFSLIPSRGLAIGYVRTF
jgi:hypothetical protein